MTDDIKENVEKLLDIIREDLVNHDIEYIQNNILQSSRAWGWKDERGLLLANRLIDLARRS